MGGWIDGWMGDGWFKTQAKALSFDMLSGFVLWSDLCLEKKIGVRRLNFTAGTTVVNIGGIAVYQEKA